MFFQVTPGTITLSNHMHNAYFCFCHDVYTRNKRTKIIYTMKIDVFFK